MVFGSRSVLLGVLLIKSLPSKCISQIRLDRNKILKKKLQRNAHWRRRRKKKKRMKIFNGWQKKRETYVQGEACSSTEMRGMKKLVQSKEMTQSGMKALCDLWRHEHLMGNLVIANSPPTDTSKRPRTFKKWTWWGP